MAGRLSLQQPVEKLKTHGHMGSRHALVSHSADLELHIFGTTMQGKVFLLPEIVNVMYVMETDAA